MANENKPYTYDDLAAKAAEYAHAQAELQKWEGMVLSAMKVVESHQREVEKAKLVVDRRREEVRKVLGNLEK